MQEKMLRLPESDGENHENFDDEGNIIEGSAVLVDGEEVILDRMRFKLLYPIYQII